MILIPIKEIRKKHFTTRCTEYDYVTNKICNFIEYLSKNITITVYYILC